MDAAQLTRLDVGHLLDMLDTRLSKPDLTEKLLSIDFSVKSSDLYSDLII